MVVDERFHHYLALCLASRETDAEHKDLVETIRHLTSNERYPEPQSIRDRLVEIRRPIVIGTEAKLRVFCLKRVLRVERIGSHEELIRNQCADELIHDR